ncbi:alpha-beta hydrolase superfamily lysophospholipase [Phycicoccus badiiscoriae]|uniref:Alpha-beta hydrolase superfamily lysophospholipase n=1 Tax=Pedococcus badiiscoriae TaxID=642776 RepID=A0A852WNB1_9MICO|nr:alpha/beta hydrolase [Pedococcus badiiscoriae]NYG06876.1 alpha-beta hydrolase superfamily lysophospholipase [Pedococcus badiiscoriae]
MQSSTFTLSTPDGTALHVNRWLPDGPPKAVVQIAHGMAEHSDRYARFGERLTAAGYAVYASDHRGHGSTARTPHEAGYFADDNGFDTVVDDLHLVTERAQSEHPGLPLFLFGHSMGSFLSRSFAARFGTELDGLVLSGTAGDPGALGKVGLALASAQARLRGRRHTSGLMDQLTFGQYGAAFKPNRTKFDWLSRDEAEVDKYVADLRCGNVFTSGFFADLLGGLAAINTDSVAARVPKDLPIFVFSGDQDPVGEKGKGPTAVADQYRRLGVGDVTLKLWPQGRHEMLNETNRDEVMDSVVDWLDAHLPAQG